MADRRNKNAIKESSIPQKHLHSRISYLFQSAAYLATVGKTLQMKAPHANSDQASSDEVFLSHSTEKPEDAPGVDLSEQLLPVPGQSHVFSRSSGLSYHLIDHLRTVSKKGQIRLSPTVKQSICKRCQAFLMSGLTMSTQVENRSRYGEKTWADVLVKTCDSCGTSKRFPIGAKRQNRKKARERKIT